MINETLSAQQTTFNQRAVAHSLGASADDGQSCEARVLEAWLDSATPLEVHLGNGPTIHGTLVASDRFMIAVLNRGKLRAIYKRAILTIVPHASVSSDHRVITRPILHLKRHAGSQPP